MDKKLFILIFLGIFLVDSTGGISGGNQTTLKWLIAIYNSRHDYICTGTIISPTKAVTSASCLGYYPDFDSASCVQESHYMALFARVSIDRRVRDKNFQIAHLIKHVKWGYDKPEYDCAIVKPRATFHEQPEVGFVPGENEADLIQTGMNVKLLGWGSTRENFPNEYKLQEGHSLTISMEDCKAQYPGEDLDQLRFVCTHKLGTGACSGDDGGPVILETQYGDKLIGIIGYRKGCGYKEYPDIHVNIFSVLDLITKPHHD